MYASEVDFRNAVEILKRLEAEGIADILIAGPFGRHGVRIILPRGVAAVAAAADDAGMTEREFRTTIRDVQDTLAAATQNVSPDDFVEARAQRTHPEEGTEVTPDGADLARRKLAVVSEAFDLRALRSRRWIKRTSKNDMLFDADWEVVKKLADNEAEAPEGAREIPSALIQLSSGPPDDAFSVVTGRGTTNVVVTMDAADVDALIRTLMRLRKALDDVDKAGE